MVLIIDGEIVPDNDPRAVAKRAGRSLTSGRGSTQQASAASAGHVAPPVNAGGAGDAGGPATVSQSPLDALASAVGVHGQSIRIPSIASVPARDVPVIHLILLGAATAFFGWRALAAAAVLHVVQGLSAGAPAPQGHREDPPSRRR